MDRKAVATFAIVAAVALVVVTLAIAAVLWAGRWLYQEGHEQHQKMQERLHEREPRERELIRARQLELIVRDLDEAAEAAAAGRTEDALDGLRQAEEQLMIVAAAATQAGDTTAGAEFAALWQQAQSAISRIQSAPEGDRRLEVARAAIGELKDALEGKRATDTTPED